MQAEMTIRICDTCKKPLNFLPDGTQSGVLCDDLYYHEGDCLNKSFEGTGETWEDHYSEDGDCYFTEWEPEIVESDDDAQFNAIIAKNILARSVRDDRENRSVLNELFQLEEIEKYIGQLNQPSARDIIDDRTGQL